MVKLNMKQQFRHSYSREFGRPINENNPKSYMIYYSLHVEGEVEWITAPIKIEYYSRDDIYMIFPLSREMDDIFDFNAYKTKKEALKYAEEKYNEYLNKFKIKK